jgi:hypothetical protein
MQAVNALTAFTALLDCVVAAVGFFLRITVVSLQAQAKCKLEESPISKPMMRA